MFKSKIKKILKNFSIPLSKTIVLESNPELACNTMPVYLELIKRHVNNTYRIVWLVEDRSKYADFDVHNVKFMNYVPQRLTEKLEAFKYRNISKAIIFSNRIQEKRWKNQLVIFLTHGMPLKGANGYTVQDKVDYVISSCEKLNDIFARGLDTDLNKFVTLGYPRTDVLGQSNSSKTLLSINSYEKTIVWMPTFRKHKGGTEIDGTALSLGIPLLDTIEQINQLNSVLSKWNILLIIKLHPAQDLNGIKEFKCSNIIFLSDERIKRCGTTLYELLAEADALLTDYSSVYYDYLLVDRPIGLIIDDIEEYERRRGIILESYMDSIKGTYIRECRDLEQFIENLAKGYDPDEKIRKWAMNEYCDYRDFKSTERVVDFILEKLNEK